MKLEYVRVGDLVKHESWDDKYFYKVIDTTTTATGENMIRLNVDDIYRPWYNDRVTPNGWSIKAGSRDFRRIIL